MADLGVRAHRQARGSTLRAALAALLALVLGMVGGCSSLPDSGSAGPGTVIDEPDPEPLRVSPVGPRPLAGPAEIVAGFLRAGAATDDDHEVARSFLTPLAASSWRPSGDVVVYPDDPDLAVTATTTGATARVDVTAPLAAQIDAAGHYVEAVSGARARATFSLVRVDDTWRVSGLDEAFGSWLPQYAVDRSFSPVPVKFVASGTTTLVADLRWLPGPAAGLATALVRQLLQGPSSYLRGAVTTGFPPGTTLAVDAVPTTGRVARVDLNVRALSATPQMRQMMWAQLTSTLRRLPAVASLELTVDGTPFDVPGVDSTSVTADSRYSDDVRVGGAAMVLSGDQLRQVQPSTGTLAEKGTALASGRDIGSLAIGPGGTPVVGVDRAGRRLLRLVPRATSPLLTGSSLVGPAFDPSGAVWTAEQTEPGALLVLSATQLSAGRGPAAVLRPAWLAGRTVVALDISRDGSRAAVVSADRSGRRRIDVAAVLRDGSDPIGLGATSLQVGQALSSVRDVAWADQANRGTLVALGRLAESSSGSSSAPSAGPSAGTSSKAGSGSSGVRAVEVLVGGPTSVLPAVTSPTAIAAGDGPRAVYVVTAAGTVLSRSGSGWVTVGQGRSVSVPQ